LHVGKKRQACLSYIVGYGTRLCKRTLIIFHCRRENWSYANRTFNQLKPLLLLLLLLPSPPASCAASTIMSHEKAGVLMPPLSPPTPSVDALPRHIVTAFKCSDWLNFRIASRTCYCLVHGSGAEDVSQSCCSICRPRAQVGGDASNPSHDGNAITPSSDNDVLSDNLWKIALVREFQFEDGTNEEVRNWMYQSFHMPPYQPGDAMSGVLSTRNMFKASSIFMSWVHWQKIRHQIQILDDRQVCVMIFASPEL